jgi:hypothetical protein
MPVIQISKIADRTKTSKNGKKYKVVTVEGTKYGSEEAWTTDIFKNKTDLLDMLEEFGPGDTANFKFVKDGNFYELNEISEPTEENLEYAASQNQEGNKGSNPPKKKSTTGGSRQSATSEKMSKAEWAKKDADTKSSIARAVALKLAMENTGLKTKTDVLVKMAAEYIPFLMGEDEILFEGFKDPEDALDPPTDD